MGYNVPVSVTGNTAHHKRKCQRLQWYSSTETGGDKSAFKVNYYYYNFFFFFLEFFCWFDPLSPGIPGWGAWKGLLYDFCKIIEFVLNLHCVRGPNSGTPV